jgi:hypothetical protein
VFNKLLIDSTAAKTDLCDLGVLYPTDKSPYNTQSVSGHRHPYTAVYDFLFSSLRDKAINFGEIGIEDNQSMKCWRAYFKNASIWGWEYYEEKIQKALNDNLEKVTYLFMDVTSPESIESGFQQTEELFDVIIDDSTHSFDDQIRIALLVHRYIKPGGYFVIEDIFRDRAESDYYESLKEIIPFYSSITFVDTEHVLKDSTGWNNDRLLVFVRRGE